MRLVADFIELIDECREPRDLVLSLFGFGERGLEGRIGVANAWAIGFTA